MSWGEENTLTYGMEVDGVTLFTPDINKKKLGPGICHCIFLFGERPCSLT